MACDLLYCRHVPGGQILAIPAIPRHQPVLTFMCERRQQKSKILQHWSEMQGIMVFWADVGVAPHAVEQRQMGDNR